MSDVIASYSAALAVWAWGATIFGLWRLWQMSGEGVELRRVVLLIGAVLVAAGLGAHQAMAWVAWERGGWTSTFAGTPLTLLYRSLWAVGLLAMAGATSWPRCGHRGWLALLAIGAAAWAVAWVV
jgi:hypothetical protein